MLFTQMFKTSLKPRRSLFASFALVAVIASVLSFAPTHGASNTLAATCANPPKTPTFNYWPITYSATQAPECHDFQAIDAAVDTNNPVWSTSEADWNDGLTLPIGGQGLAGIYIHNGAANNLSTSQTTAQNVRIITETDTTVGTAHKIKVTFTASNAPTYTKSFTVYTPSNAKLEVVPNSGRMYDYQGHQIIGEQNMNLGNSVYELGVLDACFEYSLFMTYKFKVVGVTPPTENPTLSITKSVQNTTDGGSLTNSVNAKNSDKVRYQIKVRNNGPTVAKNVTVTDNGTAGVVVDSGSTTISGTTSGLWQGAIPGTINLGDMQPNQEITITYTGVVKDGTCITHTNTARAVGDNAAAVSATASVVVGGSCGGGGNPKLEITKLVRNPQSNNSYSSSVVAYTNDRVYFKVTVKNNGNTTLNNVRMTDAIPSGLRFDDSVSGDGTPSFNSNNTFSVNFGSLSAGSSKSVEFAAVVTASGNQTICNVARATGDRVNDVNDQACVRITHNNPGNPNIVISKRAWNDTKNVNAESQNASRGDYITYTLVTTNNGSADAMNYVISDDLSQVLPLADIVSTNGGTVSGNTISYPSMRIRSGETVTKTFQVRIKQSLSSTSTYQLRNTYGNTIVINVPGTIVYEAPKTGAAGTSAVAFAGLVTAGFVVARKRKSIFKLIFA